jgi:hypothetical protein
VRLPVATTQEVRAVTMSVNIAIAACSSAAGHADRIALSGQRAGDDETA